MLTLIMFKICMIIEHIDLISSGWLRVILNWWLFCGDGQIPYIGILLDMVLLEILHAYKFSQAVLVCTMSDDTTIIKIEK